MKKALFKTEANPAALINMDLSEIQFSPFNPREIDEKDADFLGLVQSIKEKGVIEPVIIRELRIRYNQKKMELVAGERRVRAARIAAKENGGAAGATIPALVRTYSDQEALEIQTIENIQREDLNPMEEAKAFKLWLDNKNGTQEDLAKKIGKSSRYIRRRLLVQDMPKTMLKSWGKGEISLSHLEQLARVPDKKTRKKLFQEVIDYDMSTRDLAHSVESDAVSMLINHAKFDTGPCEACPKSTDYQINVMGLSASPGGCMDKDCFIRKQTRHLEKNWEASGIRKKYKTNGFRFVGQVNYDDFNIFYDFDGPVPKECKACDGFISVLNLSGTSNYNRTCFGDGSCYQKTKRAMDKSTTTGGSGPDPVERGAWHGRHFQEMFWQEAIPKKMKTMDVDDVHVQRATLLALLREGGYELMEWYKKFKKDKGQIKKHARRNTPRGGAVAFIWGLDLAQVKQDIQAVATQRILSWQFTPGDRKQMAEAMGIEIEKEYTIPKEWAEKKTIPQILAFMKKTKIDQDKKAKTFLAMTLKKKGFDKLKKTELIQVLFESGVDLLGRVPEEVKNNSE